MSETQGRLGAPGTTSTEREDPVDNFSDPDDWRDLGISAQAATWEVLSIALRNQSTPNRNWKDYVVFIRYGPAETRIERCLSWDERPLAKFMKLKDAGKDPGFVLKRAESLPSPIAIARRKIATRSARPHADNDYDYPRIYSDGVLDNTSLGSSGERGGERTIGQRPSVGSTTSENTLIVGAGDQHRPRHSHGSVFSTSTAVEILSYAVAVYPYSAEQADELDVAVGDTFVVSSRASGWLVVERDPTGSRITVASELPMKGWIPKGCVLEINKPVASAIAEATASDPNRPLISASNGPASPRVATPILAQSILTTSAPGIASMDYQRNGDWEIDLSSGDALRVFKRHAHWSYVVKTDGGGRGWVPAWFVGKVTVIPLDAANRSVMDGVS